MKSQTRRKFEGNLLKGTKIGVLRDNILNFILCMHACVWKCMFQLTCDSWKAIYRSWFSPPCM